MSQPRTPHGLGFRQPSDWEPHEAVWVAWPSHDELWAHLLPEAQKEHVALCEAIVDLDDAGRPRGEALHVLVPSGMREVEARAQLNGLGAVFHRVPYGDVWLRSFGPTFLRSREGALASACFAFDGWGGKCMLEGEDLVPARIAEQVGGELFAFGLVLEGGAIDADGEGTLLATESCLLRSKRNPGLERERLEAVLRDALGAEKVLWLPAGLANDPTDGHVDGVARFVAPGRVVCMAPSGEDDPNREVLCAVAEALAGMSDARGRALEVVQVPSPGRVEDDEGVLLPASYLSFYTANTTLVVPTFGSPRDEEAVEALGKLFPGRRVVGTSARTLLVGGGGFARLTVPQPARAAH